MNIVARNTFTGTAGVNDWNELRKTIDFGFLNGLEGIFLICDFCEKYKNRKSEIKQNYQHWYYFLLSVGEIGKEEFGYNNLDPIMFLAYKYYEEGLGIVDIHNRYGHLDDYKNCDTLRRFFVNILGWKLRDGNDRTELAQRKIRITKNTTGCQLENEKRKKVALEKATNEIKELVKDCINISEFSKELANISHKKNKILFILGRIFKQNKEETIYSLYIINMKGSGHGAIAKGINQLFINNGIRNIVISKHDIRNIIIMLEK